MWFLLAIISYFLFSTVVVLDKYFLEKSVPNPKLYLLYTSLASVFFIILIPFGFSIPPLHILIINFLASGLFVLSLYALYYSFTLDDASKIISSAGGLSAAFIYIANYILFRGMNNSKSIFTIPLDTHITLDTLKIWGILFLVCGSFIMLLSLGNMRRNNSVIQRIKKIQVRINQKILLAVLATSICSALFFVCIKIAYATQSFISAFIWVKIGIILFGLTLLFSKQVREQIKPAFKRLYFRANNVSIGAKKHRRASLTGIIIFINKLIVGGVANILQHFATSLAPLKNVSLVKALEGTEYVFVLAAAYVLSKKYSYIVHTRVPLKIK